MFDNGVFNEMARRRQRFAVAAVDFDSAAAEHPKQAARNTMI